MNPTDVERYLHRDWRAVEAAKVEFWIERKAELSAVELFALVDGFRAFERALRPDWPTEAERAADLAVHARLSEQLRRVGVAPAR